MKEREKGRRKTLFFKSATPFSPDEEISGTCLSGQSKRANFIRRPILRPLYIIVVDMSHWLASVIFRQGVTMFVGSAASFELTCVAYDSSRTQNII